MIYRAILSLILSLLLVGCNVKVASSEIGGKFVFGSSRHINGYQAHIWKNGKVSLLANKAYNPAWSPNGKLIACSVEGRFNDEIGENGILLVDESGNIKDFIKTSHVPVALSWFPEGDKIAFIGATKNVSEIMYYDLSIDKEVSIFSVVSPEKIYSIEVSPKGDKILFEKTRPNPGTYIIDINNKNRQYIRKQILPTWHPDGENLLFLTNVGEDGELLTDKYGYVFKYNIKTHKSEKLWVDDINIMNLKCSKDGKYVYYSMPYRGGNIIAVSPINNFSKRYYVTKPIRIQTGDYSQDLTPDWYQGE